MVKFVISRSAALEISGIAQYLEHELDPPDAASSFIREFGNQAKLASSFPLSHPLCPHPELVQRGYRSFRVDRYVAIYSVADDRLKILHVFHQSQDYVGDALS